MVARSNPVRGGVPKTLTLSKEAIAALAELTPSRNNQGHTVSQLLVNEMARREERQKIKAAMIQLLDERGTVCP
jgi:hypothetical protein